MIGIITYAAFRLPYLPHRRHPRELLQAAITTTGCSATEGSNTASYAACSSLTGLDSAFNIFWNYDTASRLLTGAIQGSSTTGWYGFGLTAPGSPGQVRCHNTRARSCSQTHHLCSSYLR